MTPPARRHGLPVLLLAAGCFNPSDSDTGTTADTPSTTAATAPGTTSSTGPAEPTTTDAPTTGPVIGECGNGKIEADEECDDAVDMDTDGCFECKRTALFAFVTNDVFLGEGLTPDLADTHCQNAAIALKGYDPDNFIAWLSDDQRNAIDRIGDSDLPYIRTDYVRVADNSGIFKTGILLAPISFSESGSNLDTVTFGCGTSAHLVWTFTDATGVLGPSCEGASSATAGLLNQLSAGWTEGCLPLCTESAHLYCIERRPL